MYSTDKQTFNNTQINNQVSDRTNGPTNDQTSNTPNLTEGHRIRHSLNTYIMPLQGLFLMLLLISLSGCDLSYSSNNKGSLRIEQAYIDSSTSSQNQEQLANELNSVRYENFDPDQIITFKQNQQDLLLRISVLAFPEDITEATLSISPKYIDQIEYFSVSEDQVLSPIKVQKKYQLATKNHSSEKFTFNIDQLNLNNQHFFILKSTQNHFLEIKMIDSESYGQADRQLSQLLTALYSLVLALIITNWVFYFYTRDRSYVRLSIYLVTGLFALLWQEGKINDLPWLAWDVLGPYSTMIYLGIADLAVHRFFFHFLKIKPPTSWTAKIIVISIMLRMAIIVFAVIQFHLMAVSNLNTLSLIFNASMIVSGVLAWILMLAKVKENYPQSKHIFVAWTLLLSALGLRFYFLAFPQYGYSWAPRLYEPVFVLTGFIMSFAVARRLLGLEKRKSTKTKKFKPVKPVKQSIPSQQLITQFEDEMQALVQDPSLNMAEVNEKIKIKFHLLFNKALPITSSLIHEGDKLNKISSTGLEQIDIDLLNFKLNKLDESGHHQIGEYEILTAKNINAKFMYLPIKNQDDEQLRLVFGLKNNKSINPKLTKNFQSYCQAAYTALIEAQKHHQVALAANLDEKTGFYTRESVFEIINDSMKKYSRTTLALFAVDDLAAINETHESEITDQCIGEFTELLKTHFSHHAKLGHWNGGEFMAVFSDVDFETCEEYVELFLEKLSEHRLSTAKTSVQAHIGMAESRINDSNELLIEKAETAKNHAIQPGNNQYAIYSPDMQPDKRN